MGVLLQGFFFAPGRIAGVPSPLDGDKTIPFWWDHLAGQAHQLATSGFTAIWLPPPQKGASGSFSSGYDQFDDYDLGSKKQKGTIPTRYGTREQLARCAAVLRANGIDIYLDLVENHRDGDDGRFNFVYVDGLGAEGKGRFAKGPGDFHPHVPPDPGVFTDVFQFGRDLAPINGIPKNHCAEGLMAAADWVTRAVDAQGFRLDNMKGVSTEFTVRLLRHGVLSDKFAVGEFADGNVGLIQNWANAVQHRAAAFDFPLHFALKNMCNDPGSFDMASLDHAGLAGVDPQGAVTFVENHDTDRGGVGGPIVRNKLLAYAYILTAEGYPCVFYRDYSQDRHCFGLKPSIDRLIWIHENLAAGPTLQRFKDAGVFAFERLGGTRLLVGMNKDSGTARTIQVQTGFPPHTQLRDFSDHETPITTDQNSAVQITIPRNDGGKGYVCYAHDRPITPFPVNGHPTTQDYEGASDLDIRPALDGQEVAVCRIFARANTGVTARLFFDNTQWTETTNIDLRVEDPTGKNIAMRKFDRGTGQGAAIQFQVATTGFHRFFVTGGSVPQNRAPSYKLSVTYTAPQAI